MSARPPPAGLWRTPHVRGWAVTFGLSKVGSSMVAVAVAFLAYQRSDSVVLTVVVLSGNAFPSLVFAPLSARLASTYDPVSVKVWADLANVCISTAMAVVAVLGDLSYPVLLISTFLNGSATALSSGSRPRISEMVAPEGRLPAMTGMLQAVFAASAVVGALLGGIAVATVGAGVVFAFNALSYLPLAVTIYRLPRSAAREGSARERHVVRAGVRAVFRTEPLRRAFALALVLSLGVLPVMSALPAIAHDIDPRAHVLGLLTAGIYVGGALVVWALSRLRREYVFGTVVLIGFFAAGLFVVAHTGLTAWRGTGVDAVAVAVLTLVPLGLAVALDAALVQSLVQLESPADDEASVIVAYATFSAVLVPIGGLLFGAMVDVFSLWTVLGASGVCVLILNAVFHRQFRIFDSIGLEVVKHAARHHYGLHRLHLVRPEDEDALLHSPQHFVLPRNGAAPS